MIDRSPRSRVIYIGGLLASVWAGPVFAQAADAQAVQTGAGIQDIVVTAQRRNQALNDVGITVNVIGAEAIAARQVTDMADIGKLVSGFSAVNSSLNVPVYSLRGVGFNDGSLASNATVAVYVDEIPLPYPAMTQGAVLDLERIEVLKGPQGTLYGQNSTAGTINYIAAKPRDQFGAGITASYGRFGTVVAEGYVTGPLTDQLNARLSATFTRGDDWQKSLTRGDTLGQNKRAAGRLLLNWKPSSDVTIDFNANGWIDKSDTLALQLTDFQPQRPANVSLLPAVFNSPFAPSNARAANWTPGIDYRRDDWFVQIGSRARWDVGDNVALTGIAAYSQFSMDANTDRDGMVPMNFNSFQNGSIKSFYQEVRLSGDTESLVWSFGGNYRDDKIHDNQSNSSVDATNNLGAFRFNSPTSDQKVKTFGIFADGELKITPTVSLLSGLRYTKDKRRSDACSRDFGDGQLATFFTPIINRLRAARGLAPVTIPIGGCITSDANLQPMLIRTRLNEDNVSGHVGVNWKPTSDVLVYASAARGYKSGALPTLGATTFVQYLGAKQERVDAFEGGVKSTLLDRKLQLNLAGFYYDYTNKQQRGRILDSVFGSLSVLVNVPKSRIWGLEMEALLKPAPGLTFNAAGLYLETKVKQFVGINLNSTLEDFKGQRINFSPKWSINAGGEYEFALNDWLNAVLGADLTYRSETSAFFGNIANQQIGAYTLLDLRAGIESADGRWNATVWGNNVTNEYYWSNVVRGSDGIARAAAKPASYGVRLGFKY